MEDMTCRIPLKVQDESKFNAKKTTRMWSLQNAIDVLQTGFLDMVV